MTAGDSQPSSGSAGPPGQPLGRVGPYRIVRRLGAGGMGAVYLGQHHHTGGLAAGLVLGLVLAGGATGCGGGGEEAPAGPGLHELTFEHDGTHDYLLFAPSGYDPATPVPLMVAMHGQPGDAWGIHSASGLHEVAEQEGFLLAYPDDLSRSGPLRTLVEHLVEVWNVAPDQVYATGFSAGASATWRLAVEASDVFAAVAPVSGPFAANSVAGEPELPVSVITFIGLADRRFLDRMEAGVATWRDRLGCPAGEPGWLDDTERVSLTTATCPDGSELVEYRFADMGHVWPNELAFGFAPNDAIWDFFAAHRRTG